MERYDGEETWLAVPERGADLPAQADPALTGRWLDALYETPLQFSGMLDDKGVVIAANRLCVEGCGLVRDEVIGRPFWECGWWSSDDDLAARIQEWCERCLDSGEALRATSRYYVGEGTRRMVDLTITRIAQDPDKRNGPFFLVATGLDITDSLAARAAREDRATEAARGQLLALSEALGAAHTPREVTQVVLEHTASAVATYYAGVALLDPERNGLRFVTLDGMPEQTAAEWLEVGLDVQAPLTAAVREIRPIFHNTRAELFAAYPDTEASVRETGIHSFGSTPLIVDSEVIGVLSVSWQHSHGPTEAARQFIVTAAGMCAQAIARAVLYEQAAATASELSRAILPEQAPDLPGVDLACRYETPSPGLVVGGDWWDAFVCRDGRVVVTVGDVAGHGTEAVRVMAALRYALRAYAYRGMSPAECLRDANELLLDTKRPVTTATAVIASIDIEAGRLSWASAGHLPPVIVDSAGVRLLDQHSGPLLGAARVEYREYDETIGVADLFLAYTDGLVERRGESIAVGIHRMVRALTDGASDAADACDAVLAATAGPRNHDDLCVLAARIGSAAP